jgi:hypothetical protein
MWLIIQLTPWAEKTMSVKELTQELRRKTQISDLEIYYPVIEDVVGKHLTPFSEYLFVKKTVGIPLHEVEGGEIFRTVLRDPYGNPCEVSCEEVEKIRLQIEAEEKLRPKERVQINKGPLRGNVGEVLCTDDTQVIVRVILGDETLEAVIPRKWVRRKGKRKKLPYPLDGQSEGLGYEATNSDGSN